MYLFTIIAYAFVWLLNCSAVVKGRSEVRAILYYTILILIYFYAFLIYSHICKYLCLYN